MNVSAPSVDKLTRRLTECPSDLFREPLIAGRGIIHVPAVVNDLIVDLGGAPARGTDALVFKRASADSRNFLQTVMVAAWLLRDDYFVEEKRFASLAFNWLGNGLADVSKLVSAELFITDPDRREELVRACLKALGLIPEGETKERADDRLQSLDSVARDRISKETAREEERARKLREAMAAKEAAESAAKSGREW